MIELNKENFEQEVTQHDGLAIVDFWGTTCEPCKAFMPDYQALADTYGTDVKFCKLQVDGNRRLAISLKVMGLPTIQIYKNGEKVATMGPDINKTMVEEELKKFL